MDETKALLFRIHTEQPSFEIQQEVLDLLARTLHSYREQLGYWEKSHFAQSIGAAATNVQFRTAPTHFWLKCALLELEKAQIPAEDRNENYIPTRDDFTEELTYQHLSDAIETLRGSVQRHEYDDESSEFDEDNSDDLDDIDEYVLIEWPVE